MNQKAPQPLVDLKGIPPKHYARATEAQGNLRRFSEYCKKYKATTPELSGAALAASGGAKRNELERFVR